MLYPLSFPNELLVDSEGRPAREINAPAALLVGVPMELTECNYPGTRHKHKNPMNVSALRQMHEHWDDVLAGMNYLRSLYHPPGGVMRYVDVWRIGELGAKLLSYVHFRRDNPIPNHEIPPHVAAIFKIFIGMNQSVFHLAQVNLMLAPDRVDEAVDPDELYVFLEGAGLLIGPDQVCAGPEALIRKAIHAMVDEPDPQQVAAAHATREIAGPIEPFLEYAFCRMNETVMLSLYMTLCESIFAQMRTALEEHEATRASVELLAVPESELTLFVGADDSAKGIIQRLLESALYCDVDDGDRLREACDDLSDVFDRTPAIDTAQLRTLLGGQAARWPEEALRNVGVYLRLEQVGQRVSKVLKHQCLRSLGFSDSPQMMMVSDEFVPPWRRMRNVLGTCFDAYFTTGKFLAPGGFMSLDAPS